MALIAFCGVSACCSRVAGAWRGAPCEVLVVARMWPSRHNAPLFDALHWAGGGATALVPLPLLFF